MSLNKKILPKHKDLRFLIHKIDQTEESPPKNKICPKNKDLRFPLTKNIADPKSKVLLAFELY